MALTIEELHSGNRQEWDNFVNSHPEGRFSQLAGYKDVVEKTFNYKPSYWLFRGKGRKVKAVFPLFIKKSWLLGNKIVSQPFCEYGGPLGSNLTEEDAVLVRSRLHALLEEHRVPFLEVHGGLGLPQDSMKSLLLEKPLHQYAVLRLTSSDEVWDKKLDRMVRKAVRKSQRSELECTQQTNEKTIKETFYPLYLCSMKKFGTPPHPLSFFLYCLQYLPEYMKLFTVRYQDETIAALLGFVTGKRVHIIITASNEKHWDKRPNDLAHWEFVKWACDNGYEYFDFGPVRYAGQRQFKEKWGVDLFDYSYFYLSRQGNELPQIDAYSGRAKFLASLWRRLVPLPLTGIVGPWFRKQLGD